MLQRKRRIQKHAHGNEEQQSENITKRNHVAYVFASDYDEMVTTPNSEYMPAGAKIHSQNA